MDPMETLNELRETCAKIVEIITAGDDPEDLEILASTVAEKFQALDDWMRGQRRGYSPWDVERDRADRAGMPRGVQVGNYNEIAKVIDQ